VDEAAVTGGFVDRTFIPVKGMFATSFNSRDTIFALSTGPGKAAIAVVRVSGSKCSSILSHVCPGAVFRDREARLSLLLDHEQNPLDRAVVIRFFAPRSFTGEEMVEFQVTGSRAILTALLRTLAQCPGTRPADAGEFAKRAFENGKLDLVEIEGLASVVAAETSAQLRHAMAMASGTLSRRSEDVRELLLRAIAYVESLLDFSDIEDATQYSVQQVFAIIEDVKSILTQMIAHDRVGERLRDGMIVVIAGSPNVGKSTLLNYFARRDVAIVSSIPGTTRDSLEVSAEILGFPVTFIDTAGLRETEDVLEAQGIARTVERTNFADLVLWLFDRDSAPDPPASLLRPVQKVRTKADLDTGQTEEEVAIAISTKSGKGIDDLLSSIGGFAERHFEGAGSLIFGTERQRSAVSSALSGLSRVLQEPGMPLELVAEDLRHAARSLSRITGRIEVEEVLTEIFSRLCVGK
jgi:tRNA modification GTPase